jgi:predicted acyltransferase (DUF342 family)
VSALPVVALVLMVLGMLAVPLIPSLKELRDPTDCKPLSVIQEHAGEIRHFASGFRNYISSLRPALQQCTATGTTAHGVLPDGCEYLILGRPVNFSEMKIRDKEAVCELVVLAGTLLKTPDNTTFAHEIYAGEDFIGGENSTYRAILGEKNIRLAPGSRVLRWVHALGNFGTDHHCDLFGRVSSDRFIHLGVNTQFLRVNAPRIELGSLAVADDREMNEPSSFTSADERIVHRLLIDGDHEIEPGEIVTGSVVARGRLLVRAGARIHGSIKSYHEMILEPDVTVTGSLISTSSMTIGNNCLLHGPIIAERQLSVAAGTRCGSSSRPTTVSSPRIDIEEGTLVFGTLWAREYGRVVVNL